MAVETTSGHGQLSTVIDVPNGITGPVEIDTRSATFAAIYFSGSNNDTCKIEVLREDGKYYEETTLTTTGCGSAPR